MNASAQHAPRIEPLAKRGASGRLGFGFRMPLSTMGVQSLTCNEAPGARSPPMAPLSTMGVQSLTCNISCGLGAGLRSRAVNHGSAVPYLQHKPFVERAPDCDFCHHGSAVPYLQPT